MKVYVATKFEQATYAKKTMEALESAGHTITHDWTGENSDGMEDDVLKQYLVRCANSDLNGVKDCDVLLLLNHQHGKGMFTELGMAIAFDKKVVVVDAWKAHNIFFSLPHCTTVQTVGEAIELIQKWHKEA
jgi:hypothetical protein